MELDTVTTMDHVFDTQLNGVSEKRVSAAFALRDRVYPLGYSRNPYNDVPTSTRECHFRTSPNDLGPAHHTRSRIRHYGDGPLRQRVKEEAEGARPSPSRRATARSPSPRQQRRTPIMKNGYYKPLKLRGHRGGRTLKICPPQALRSRRWHNKTGWVPHLPHMTDRCLAPGRRMQDVEGVVHPVRDPVTAVAMREFEEAQVRNAIWDEPNRVTRRAYAVQKREAIEQDKMRHEQDQRK